MPIEFNNQMINFLNAAGFYVDELANRPNDVSDGVFFTATDTQEIFIFWGGVWVLIGSGGGGGANTLQQVLTAGNVSDLSINIYPDNNHGFQTTGYGVNLFDNANNRFLNIYPLSVSMWDGLSNVRGTYSNEQIRYIYAAFNIIVEPNTLTANRIVKYPDKSGTLLVDSDNTLQAVTDAGNRTTNIIDFLNAATPTKQSEISIDGFFVSDTDPAKNKQTEIKYDRYGFKDHNTDKKNEIVSAYPLAADYEHTLQAANGVLAHLSDISNIPLDVVLAAGYIATNKNIQLTDGVNANAYFEPQLIAFEEGTGGTYKAIELTPDALVMQQQGKHISIKAPAAVLNEYLQLNLPNQVGSQFIPAAYKETYIQDYAAGVVVSTGFVLIDIDGVTYKLLAVPA